MAFIADSSVTANEWGYSASDEYDKNIHFSNFLRIPSAAVYASSSSTALDSPIQ